MAKSLVPIKEFKNESLTRKINFRLDKVKDILAIQFITFWNIWYWYVWRVTDHSDEPLGLIALFSAIFFLRGVDYNKQLNKNQLSIISILLLFYIISYTYTSDMIHALIGIFSIGYTLYQAKEKISPAIFGLFFLSLPVIASMQFYLGYPLRMISGFFTVGLLKMNGFYVIQEGTCLKLGEALICIDAPCSGVNMLWTGFFFTFFISCLYKLNLKKVVIALCISFASIVITNIIRSTALFYMESGILHLPSFAHQGIGLTTFIVSVAAVFIYVNIGDKKCEV